LVDVVGLGLNAMDTIILLPRFPVPMTKTPILSVHQEPGGQVATALVTCARLGLSTRYIGSVGSDQTGRAQIESLDREGVDTSAVRVVEGAGSQMAVILVEAGVGERTVLWHRDPRLTYPPDSVPEEVVRSGRILHLDGHDSAAALAAAAIANAAGIPVVIDIDRVYDDSTFDLLERVDYLIAAEELATTITGESDPSAAAAALGARFPRALTGVTLGGRGAVFVLDGVVEASPAFEVDVRDTTGAGDVFHGAFIYGMLRGWKVPETVRFAHAVAAIKCTAVGARTAIPRLDEAMAFLGPPRGAYPE
jgi:sugar/nucleoside kinase (ribokinase family)